MESEGGAERICLPTGSGVRERGSEVHISSPSRTFRVFKLLVCLCACLSSVSLKLEDPQGGDRLSGTAPSMVQVSIQEVKEWMESNWYLHFLCVHKTHLKQKK